MAQTLDPRLAHVGTANALFPRLPWLARVTRRRPRAAATAAAAARAPSALRPRRQHLLEIVTPRTNGAAITAVENLLEGAASREAFSLEIAATRTARWFLARTGSESMRVHLEAQLGAAYPQADLNRLDVAAVPGFDPAKRLPDEQVAACTFVLERPEYLPLRTFGDVDVAADRAPHAAQNDPMLPILAALGQLPESFRATSQLVLRPAPAHWCRDYLPLALERPLPAQAGGGGAPLDPQLCLLLIFMLGVPVALQLSWWYEAGEWLKLAAAAGGGAAGGTALFWGYRRVRELLAPRVFDPRQVQEKLRGAAYTAQVRLAVFAPRSVASSDVQAQLDRLAATYGQFTSAAGNSLSPVLLRLQDRHGRYVRDLRTLAPLPPRRAAPVLNTRELAALWHLPQARADVPLLERTTARKWLPPPHVVGHGCRIGESSHQGRNVPVHVPDELLGRHLLLVAKTRRGKSSLMLHFARYLMGRPAGAAHDEQRALVLVDPHEDLAQAALGLVPPERRGDVVYLNLAEQARPFGFNLLDAALGWTRDKAVANALALFRREFDSFWGPRMEDCFRFALLTLFEANQEHCRQSGGRGRQHTVLDVPAVLADKSFRRRQLLPLVADDTVKAWWSNYWDLLEPRNQIEILNPVATKVQRFAASHAARAIVGQPRSTIDPAAWVREGKLVIVNTAKGTVGEDTAALLGGCLINLAAPVVSEQQPGQRRPATIIADEFHSMPGADYEVVLAELAKYRANLILATQGLGQLQALDRQQERSLQATVFENIDGLFAFHCAAEDARYLVHELGGGVDEQDPVQLGEHRCYAKWSAGGERLPLFSVRLDPPPRGDSGVAATLAEASAALYGRAREAVDRDITRALQRIEDARKGQGGKRDGHTEPRHEHRPRKHAVEPHQATLPNIIGRDDEDATASEADADPDRSEAASGGQEEGGNDSGGTGQEDPE